MGSDSEYFNRSHTLVINHGIETIHIFILEENVYSGKNIWNNFGKIINSKKPFVDISENDEPAGNYPKIAYKSVKT